MTKQHILLCCLLALMPFFANAQEDEKPDEQQIPLNTFQAGLILGFNAGQIDGDDLAGYNKLGIVAGGQVAYRLRESWMPSVSILFSQKGSRSQPQLDGFLTNYSLNYVEVPVVLNYMDGGIRISGGLSYGRLLSLDLLQRDIDETNLRTPYYRDTDISTVLGFGYFINKNWGFDFRWTRSIFSTVNIDFGNVINERQINKTLSFRAIYLF